MYEIREYHCEASVEEYLRDYVNVEEFLGYCRECKNYDHTWSCPPYDFDPEDYWKKFSTFYITTRKIIFKQETSKERSMEIMQEVKDDMSRQLYEMEKRYEGSVALSAGSCSLCREEGCTRIKGLPCRHPDLMRYSIESIGGNVGLTVSKLMGIELEWIEEGRVPSYFVLVGGLLRK